MVGTHARFRFVLYSDVFPTERCLVYVQTPDIIDGLRASVPSKDEQIRLVEDKRVAVAPIRGSSDYWNNHPLCSSIAISQVEQVQIIRGQASSYPA